VGFQQQQQERPAGATVRHSVVGGGSGAPCRRCRCFAAAAAAAAAARPVPRPPTAPRPGASPCGRPGPLPLPRDPASALHRPHSRAGPRWAIWGRGAGRYGPRSRRRPECLAREARWRAEEVGRGTRPPASARKVPRNRVRARSRPAFSRPVFIPGLPAVAAHRARISPLPPPQRSPRGRAPLQVRATNGSRARRRGGRGGGGEEARRAAPAPLALRCPAPPRLGGCGAPLIPAPLPRARARRHAGHPATARRDAEQPAHARGRRHGRARRGAPARAGASARPRRPPRGQRRGARAARDADRRCGRGRRGGGGGSAWKGRGGVAAAAARRAPGARPSPPSPMRPAQPPRLRPPITETNRHRQSTPPTWRRCR
jgi:hypothetical protein